MQIPIAHLRRADTEELNEPIIYYTLLICLGSLFDCLRHAMHDGILILELRSVASVAMRKGVPLDLGAG